MQKNNKHPAVISLLRKFQFKDYLNVTKRSSVAFWNNVLDQDLGNLFDIQLW